MVFPDFGPNVGKMSLITGSWTDKGGKTNSLLNDLLVMCNLYINIGLTRGHINRLFSVFDWFCRIVMEKSKQNVGHFEKLHFPLLSTYCKRAEITITHRVHIIKSINKKEQPQTRILYSIQVTHQELTAH